MNIRKMVAMFREFRAGAPLGDVAVLKFDALSAPPRGINEKLADVRGYAPEQNLEKLRQLPAGTLGRVYADFLDRNGIQPLVVSPHIVGRFRNNPYVLRYTMTHDLHHVLAGFDTGLAGEIGVHAFAVGQGSGAGGRPILWLARFLHPLVSPSQTRKIWHNIRVGLDLGQRARLLLAHPLESYFEEPLPRVRERLRIPVDPASAGVLASGRSLFAEWIYGKKPATS